MSHFSGSSGDSGGQGHSGGLFHYAVGDNYNPLGTYSDIYNMENLTEGLRINNGIRFAILFISFAGWLYIVYWIRHHEPVLQKSVGIHTAAPTTNQDKSIVASIRNAFPLKTSAEFGSIYVPSSTPVGNTPSSYQPETPISQSKSSPSPAKLGFGEAISAPINYVDRDFDQRFGSPVNPQFPSTSSAVTEPILSNPTRATSTQSKPTQPDIKCLYTSYSFPVRSGNSTLLRTIVNR